MHIAVMEVNHAPQIRFSQRTKSKQTQTNEADV